MLNNGDITPCTMRWSQTGWLWDASVWKALLDADIGACSPKLGFKSTGYVELYHVYQLGKELMGAADEVILLLVMLLHLKSGNRWTQWLTVTASVNTWFHTQRSPKCIATSLAARLFFARVQKIIWAQNYIASNPGHSLKTAWQLTRVQTGAALELTVTVRFQNASRDSCRIFNCVINAS